MLRAETGNRGTRRVGWIVLAVGLFLSTACSTVKVHVVAPQQAVQKVAYSYHFLSEDEKEWFEGWIKEHRVDEWLNAGANGDVSKRQEDMQPYRFGEAPEDEPKVHPVKGPDGIRQAEYFLFVLGLGSEFRSGTTYILETREDLVSWPYWSDGYVTVSANGLELGRPETKQVAVP